MVVARDKTVKKIKGQAPQNREKQRVSNLKKLKIANQVLLGNHGDRLTIISEIKPDIICLGYDQKDSIQKLRQQLKKRGLIIRIIRLKSFKPRLYKSSIYKRLAQT